MNLTSPQLAKKFPSIYETLRFITAFTTARHLSPSWAKQPSPCLPDTTSLRLILILSSHEVSLTTNNKPLKPTTIKSMQKIITRNIIFLVVSTIEYCANHSGKTLIYCAESTLRLTPLFYINAVCNITKIFITLLCSRFYFIIEKQRLADPQWSADQGLTITCLRMRREFGGSYLWKTWQRCANQIIFYFYKSKETNNIYMEVYTLEMILAKRAGGTRGGLGKNTWLL